MTTVLRDDGSHLDGAAQVWAEATAARDGFAEASFSSTSTPRVPLVTGHGR
jgi:hypothetical protein